MIKNQTIMYMGPDIKGIVRNGTTFANGIPKNLQKLSEHKAFLKELLVPISDIALVSKLLRTEGSFEAVAYNKIKEITQEEIWEILKGE